MEDSNQLIVPEDKSLMIQPPQIDSNVVFHLTNFNEAPILELKANGDIYVKGELVENDIEVVDAMRDFLIYQGFLKYEKQTKADKNN